MKVNAPAEPQAQRVLGKEFLIVIVVVCSALSFSLGFLVGRNGREARPETAAVPPPQTPAQQAQPEVRPQAAVPQTEQKQEPLQATGQQQVVAQDTKAGGSQGPPQQAPNAKKETQTGESARVSADSGEVFVVQLGAMRSPAEARRLRDRLAKKGYKATILSAKDKKGEKIYKIRTGEFRDRKEAEALARKLKKAEGLNTFVTPGHHE